MMGDLVGGRDAGEKEDVSGTSSRTAQSQSHANSANRVDYLFVCPSLIEPATKRGGGIEEVDYQVAKHLPGARSAALLGPFYPSYKRRLRATANIWIEYVAFPAARNYPPSSKAEVFWTTVVAQPLYCIPLVLRLRSLLKAKPKYVVVHNGLPGLLACTLGWTSGTRIIYSEGNAYPWVNPFPSDFQPTIAQRGMRVFKVATGRIIGRLAWRVRAQSNRIKGGLVSNGVSDSKIAVIPGGVDPVPYSSVASATGSNATRVAFVGRLDEAKGAPLLLEVVKLAGKTLRQVRFVILGDGTFRPQLHEQPNVEDVGWVDREQLKERLSGVSMVLSFVKELGLAELEAMASAKAIIASNVGEVPSIIRHLDNGFLCAPTPEAYVAAIGELIRNPELIRKLSFRARETITESHSWVEIARQWISMTQAGPSGDEVARS